MPRKLTSTQISNRAIRRLRQRVRLLEQELDSATSEERKPLLVTISELEKELSRMEVKKAERDEKQSLGPGRPRNKHIIGFHHLEKVIRGNGYLLACYQIGEKTFSLPIPNSAHKTSMAKYAAFCATRDSAEERAKAEQMMLVTAPVGAEILAGGSPKPKHICDRGCELLGCSINKRKPDAPVEPETVKPEPPEPVKLIESTSAETSPVTSDAPTGPTPPVSADSSPAEAPTAQPKFSPEIEQWVFALSRKYRLVPDASLANGETVADLIAIVKQKAARLRELNELFARSLSSHCTDQIGLIQRVFFPMVCKLLAHDPQALKELLGSDTEMLLTKIDPKHRIDSGTQILIEHGYYQPKLPKKQQPRYTGYLGPASDLENLK